MKNKLTLMDLKDALWDKRFRQLFPELREQMQNYLKDPGCSCNTAFLRSLLYHKERLQRYFPSKDIVTPEEEDVVASVNTWAVVNCPVEQLETKLKALPAGKRMMAVARFKDRCTAILNDVDAALHVAEADVERHVNEARAADLNWRVINCGIGELLGELRKLTPGRKMLSASRYQDQISVVVSDLAVIF